MPFRCGLVVFLGLFFVVGTHLARANPPPALAARELDAQCEARLIPNPEGQVVALRPSLTEAQRHKLVQDNYRFLLSMVNQFAKSAEYYGLQESDLISLGHKIILDAAKYFDPSKGVKFISYVGPSLRNGFSEILKKAKAAKARTINIDEPQRSDDGNGRSLHEVIADKGEHAQTESSMVESEQAHLLRVLATVFRTRLNEQRRVVFDERIYSPDAEITKTLDEVGALLGNLSKERVRRIQEEVEGSFIKMSTAVVQGRIGVLALLRHRLTLFKKMRSAEEALIVQERLASISPLSPESMAARTGLPAARLRGLEQTLISDAIVHEKALQRLEAALPEMDRQIFQALVIRDPGKHATVHSLARELKTSQGLVSRHAELLRERALKFIPLLIQAEASRLPLTTRAFEELASREDVTVSRQEIGEALGLSPYSGYEAAVDYFKARLHPNFKGMFEQGLLQPLPASAPEVASRTGLNSRFVQKHYAPLQKKLDELIPSVQRLIETGAEIPPHLAATLDLGVGEQFFTDAEVLRPLLNQRDRDLLQHGLDKGAQGWEGLAEKYRETPEALADGWTQLVDKIETDGPLFRELRESGVDLQPKSILQALRSRGITLSEKELRSRYVFTDETSYVGHETALAFIREKLSPEHRAILDERIIGPVILKTEDFARKHRVKATSVGTLQLNVEKKLKTYIPAVELLLAEGASRNELTAERIAEAVRRTSPRLLTAAMVRRELNLQAEDPLQEFNRPKHKAAVDRLASLLSPAKRLMLFEIVLNPKPLTYQQLASRIGAPATANTVRGSCQRLKPLVLSSLQAIGRLEAAGKDITLETLAEALSEDGQAVTASALKRSFGGSGSL